jgi:putative endonuclease
MWGKRPPHLSPTQQQGRVGEQAALAYLKRQGLRLVQANFSCLVGEIDLIMREGDTLVFVEVRERESSDFGGAAASVGAVKQRKILRAAQSYLQRFDEEPACRIDVITIEGGRIDWLRGAIEAD